MTETIEIPTTLVGVRGDSTFYDCDFSGQDCLVLYHTAEECSTCLLAHQYQDCGYLKDLEEEGSCRVIVIMSPQEDEAEEIVRNIRTLSLDFTIYVDLYGDFSRDNPRIPSDARFHSFLLNAEGRPVFVGNPFMSQSLMRVFRKALESLEH